MNILFLDDNEERHIAFAAKQRLEPSNKVQHVWTAAECIKALSNIKYDLVSLDHDLGGKQYVDSAEPGHGSEVSKYIKDSLPLDKYPDKIIIHSYNPVGAKNMYEDIKQTTIPVEYIPFKI